MENNTPAKNNQVFILIAVIIAGALIACGILFGAMMLGDRMHISVYGGDTTIHTNNLPRFMDEWQVQSFFYIDPERLREEGLLEGAYILMTRMDIVDGYEGPDGVWVDVFEEQEFYIYCSERIAQFMEELFEEQAAAPTTELMDEN